ncbi:ABC-type uncharacterized transport system, periplasmic component [Opitutaceae bacterium TAV1]|nr:ABC transporter substrate-binding protein [Opitutaceae bacterium TAV5]EIP99407.1 ABC-type uncharacterized transport system, periplasmic component [Opitutaceae bacterium TAV1]
MLAILKRLSLALLLIAGSAALLLFSDLDSRKQPAGSPSAGPDNAATPAGKKWKIAVIFYNETPSVEQVLEGMAAAWKRSPLLAGRDYDLRQSSAQGDMATLNTLIDAALTDGADLVVPITTPALQAAVQRVRRIPIVFSLVASPAAAGAGASDTDHLPNLTGVAVPAPCDEALGLIRKHFPGFRRIGSIYCPAEANSVAMKESLEEACRRHGFALELVAANTANDLPDAALALVSRPVDAVLQIPDNLSSSGFAAITRAARQARKPLLSLDNAAIPLGAAFTFGRDQRDAGAATVALIERVIRGEDPARIPIHPAKITTSASPANAAAVGLTLPPGLLAETGQILK